MQKMNQKQKQRHLLAKVRPFMKISNIDIAIDMDVSASLVSCVWSGLNKNPKIIKTILSNLQDEWMEHVTPEELTEIESLCKN